MSVVSGINCDSDVLIKCEVLALRGTTRTLREKIEDLKEKNEKLTKNIDFIRDCDRKAIEKLQKENEKLKERQMIMGAVADEHINDMNDIHKDYDDKVRKLKMVQLSENKRLKKKVYLLQKSDMELREEVENLSGFVDWWCDKCDCPLHEEEVHRLVVKGLTGGYHKFCEGCFNEEQEKEKEKA